MDPKANLLLIIVGSFIGLTMSLFLLTVKSVKNKANFFLGLYVLLISVYLFQGFFYRMEWLQLFPHIIHLQFLYEGCAGALIYLYVRACTERNFQMRPILWLHFLPFFINIIYILPLLMQSGEEKIAYYYNFIMAFKNVLSPIASLIKALLAMVYLVLSFRLIQQYKKHLSNEASSIDYTFHRWLLLFSSSSLLPIVGVISWVFIGANETTKTVILSFIFIFVFSTYLVALFKPEIFHTFPNQIKVQAEKEASRKKYESSSLQDNKKKEFVEKLVAYMKSEKPYKEPDLTLSTLAERVNIPSHYLSQVINEKMQCPFLDFVNGYRVNEAKKMLKDNTYENYTIIALAYEAGFNSKSAFYSAFKKHTGLTPSAFKKQVAMA